MDVLKLNEQEQRYYNDLFTGCDVDSSGIVTGKKAIELFLSSGLQQDVLHQITEVCGAKRLGHFGRSQFYIALKLIAAAQCGLPVTLETLNSNWDTNLPLFGHQFDAGDGRRVPPSNKSYNQNVGNKDYIYSHIDSVGQGHHQLGGQLPPPPKHARGVQPGARVIPGYDGTVPQSHNGEESSTKLDDTTSPGETHEGSPPVSPGKRQMLEAIGKQQTAPANIGNGTRAYVNNSQFEHPHKMEKGWASFEEDREGLISQDKKEWANFADSSKAETSSITSSEAESVDEVWIINDEQREYYTNQFKSMQPDLNGIISGAVAKEFFEKSKLPVPELSKIWQLSDVNRDGALSLEEFCTAMHLVVLRRNDVALPDSLPPSLMPYVPLVNPEEPFAADLPPGSTLKRYTPTSPQPPSQQWVTTFPPVASPTSSSVSSPGTKPTPVNFEFQPINPADPDSKIVHPVALRMSPDGQPINMEGRTFSDPDCNEIIERQNSGEVAVTSPTSMQRSFTESAVEIPGPTKYPPMHLSTPLQSRPRPTPKKSHSISGPQPEPQAAQALLRPPPVGTSQDAAERPSVLNVGANGSNAPPPPPRSKGHSRSSSLDNKLIDLSDGSTPGTGGQSQLVPPPTVPPRPSPKDGSQMSASYTASSTAANEGNGAVDVSNTISAIKKPSSPLENEGDEKRQSKFMFRHGSMDKKDLHAAVRKNREKNSMLSRLNNELNQELQEVMEQRIALEIQLEHLRPFSS